MFCSHIILKFYEIELLYEENFVSSCQKNVWHLIQFEDLIGCVGHLGCDRRPRSWMDKFSGQFPDLIAIDTFSKYCWPLLITFQSSGIKQPINSNLTSGIFLYPIDKIFVSNTPRKDIDLDPMALLSMCWKKLAEMQFIEAKRHLTYCSGLVICNSIRQMTPFSR